MEAHFVIRRKFVKKTQLSEQASVERAVTMRQNKEYATELRLREAAAAAAEGKVLEAYGVMII